MDTAVGSPVLIRTVGTHPPDGGCRRNHRDHHGLGREDGSPVGALIGRMSLEPQVGQAPP